MRLGKGGCALALGVIVGESLLCRHGRCLARVDGVDSGGGGSFVLLIDLRGTLT